MSEIATGAPSKTIWRRVTITVTIIVKSSKVVAAIKLLKFAKPLVTLVSLLVSTLLYGFFLGPLFGIGLVAVLMLHEMGHVIALRMKGMECRGPVFIPFLGAAIFLPSFKDRGTEASVAFGGPLIGTIGVIVCLAGYAVTGSEILIVLAYLGAFINLFNLIPLSPLDGGRICQIVGPWFKYIGMSTLLLATLAMRQPSMLMIWILCLDTLSFLPRYGRPVIGAVLAAIMAALMLLGYSIQPWAFDALDILWCCLLIAIYLDRDISGGAESETSDSRAYPHRRTSLLWLVAFSALAAMLVALLLGSASLLPPIVISGAAA